MNRSFKGLLVVCGAIGVSTLAINASDFARGLDGSLVGMLNQSGGVCGKNAKLLQLGSRALCIDVYEASPDEGCSVSNTVSALDTEKNMSLNTCAAASVENVQPWRFVSHVQAQQLCARTGKRLPSNEEWYKAVLGLVAVENCVIGINKPSLQPTGASACVTPSGIHDMVGNLWEWVDGEVTDGVYKDRRLPEQGYVALVDTSGVVLETTDIPSVEYGEDYAWTSSGGVKGMIRGGFYGSESDAGLFTLNTAVDLDFKSAGVGFRCVKDV